MCSQFGFVLFLTATHGKCQHVKIKGKPQPRKTRNPPKQNPQSLLHFIPGAPPVALLRQLAKPMCWTQPKVFGHQTPACITQTLETQASAAPDEDKVS